MANAIREYPWSETELGPVTAWPARLQGAVETMLASALPTSIWWGPRLIGLHNDATLALSGLNPPGDLGRPAAEVWSARWPEIGPRVAHVLETGQPTIARDLPIQIERDGRREDAFMTFSLGVVRDDGGAIGGIQAIGVETPAGNPASRTPESVHPALAASEERVRAVWDATSDALALSDPDGIVLAINPAYTELYGLSPAEAVGQEFSLIFPATERAAALERYRTIFTAPETRASAAARVQDAQGRERSVEVRANFIERDGERVAMISAIRDVTEREALEAAREAFVDAAAHDLRNPLTTLKGQAQILRRRMRTSGDLDIDAVIDRLDAIDSAANHMTRLLDEMLDASALQAGRTLELRQDHTDLIVQTEVAVEEAQRRTSRHVIRIESAVPALVGVWDEARLSRVLGNLLDNAVKYSPDGGEIVVRIWREPDAGGWAVLSVSDPGVGIPRDDLVRLFERFHRGHNVRNIRGTGIGLSGVKRIVEQHGGTVEAVSIEGQGSTFTVRLPLQP